MKLKPYDPIKKVSKLIEGLTRDRDRFDAQEVKLRGNGRPLTDVTRELIRRQMALNRLLARLRQIESGHADAG